MDVDDKEKSSGDRHRSRDREASKDKDVDSRNGDKHDKVSYASLLMYQTNYIFVILVM